MLIAGSAIRGGIGTVRPAGCRGGAGGCCANDTAETPRDPSNVRMKAGARTGRADDVEPHLPLEIDEVDLRGGAAGFGLHQRTAQLVVAERLLDVERQLIARADPVIQRRAGRRFGEAGIPAAAAEIDSR